MYVSIYNVCVSVRMLDLENIMLQTGHDDLPVG
jgi:hypothetical protein